MKKIFTLALLLSVIGVTAFAQFANQSLSNLSSPTAVNKNLLPNSSGLRDLGSSSKSWRDLYVKGFLFINGKKFLSDSSGYGSSNTLLGDNALFSNTTGNNSTAAGDHAMFANTTGNENTAIGSYACYSNTTGSSNTAVGAASLNFNTTGYSNTAIGSSALYYNVFGNDNTATGEAALLENTSDNNTADGSFALSSNTTGSYNTAIGEDALILNTSGLGNTSAGAWALYLNSTGSWNSATGLAALQNSNGGLNTANGYAALYLTTSGNNNTAVGSEAGYNITTGSNNTFLGYNANSGSVGAGNNMTAVGNGATVTSSNHIVIGNSSVTSIGGVVNWSNLSDGRVKKNIQENVPGLAFINKLQPITYNLDLDAADKIIDRPEMKDKDGKVIQPKQQDLDAYKAKEQIVYTGFVAQDVEKAAQSLSYDFSGVDKPDNENTLYGLRYSDFVVPLVKAVQELSAKNDSKDEKIDSLESTVGNLQAENKKMQNQLDRLQSTMADPQSQMNDGFAKLSWDGSNEITLLGQNVPNPFDNSTLIPFRIPKDCKDASIMITNTSTSEVISVIPISCNEDHVQVDAGTLSSGTYLYSLYVSGKMIDTKQMVLTK